MKKDFFIGVLVSLFATFGALFLYLEYFSHFGFYKSIELIEKGNLYSKVLSLGVIPNLFVFLIYIKKKQDIRAKGVLTVIILIALTTLFLKFF